MSRIEITRSQLLYDRLAYYWRFDFTLTGHSIVVNRLHGHGRYRWIITLSYFDVLPIIAKAEGSTRREAFNSLKILISSDKTKQVIEKLND